MTGRRFSPTARGWTLSGAAVGLLVGGRLLGADILTTIGIAAFAVIVLAGAPLVARWSTLTVTRRIHPARLQVDDAARVDLVVTARRPSALVHVIESIDDDRLRARFLIAPLRSGAIAETAYRLPTDRRGPLTLGPTTAVRTDPLGLTSRRVEIAPAEQVLVRPRVFAIAPPVLGAGRRHSADDAESPRAPAADAGGEFLAVRPYEVGDDPRRVHWRSSARTDDLMVRQFVTPRIGRTVVVLDTRTPDHRPADGRATDPAFERAVEATASIVAALTRARRPVECITTAGTVIADSRADLERTLDRLATVMMDEPDRIDGIARTRRRQSSELVIVVSARADGRVEAARHALARRTPSMLVTTGGSVSGSVAGATVVDARVAAFPDAWRAANPTYRTLRARTARPVADPYPVP